MAMKKTRVLAFSLLLAMALLVGCGSNGGSTETPPITKGDSVKTGMAVITAVNESVDATANADGVAQADSTIVGVMVADDGRIVKCMIDAAQSKINFSNAGKLITALNTQYETKQELGDDYGVKKTSTIGKEWNEQINALADYVTGKTIDEVKGIAVTETGVPTGADLKSSVTIKINTFIDAIEKAVANAKDLGAKADDKLGMGVVTNIAKSTDATEAEEGLAQIDSNYAILTLDSGGKITSSVIDASQTGINFTAAGKITTDLKAEQQTKGERGDSYGMKKASSLGKEWNEEAAAFAEYIVDKTVADVKGIAVSEAGKATGSDLSSSVTISVTPFITAVEKAGKAAK